MQPHSYPVRVWTGPPQFFDIQRVRAHGVPLVLKTSAPSGWLFNSATRCHFYRCRSIGRTAVSKTANPRSSRGAGAKFGEVAIRHGTRFAKPLRSQGQCEFESHLHRQRASRGHGGPYRTVTPDLLRRRQRSNRWAPTSSSRPIPTAEKRNLKSRQVLVRVQRPASCARSPTAGDVSFKKRTVLVRI